MLIRKNITPMAKYNNTPPLRLMVPKANIEREMEMSNRWKALKSLAELV